MSTILLRRSLPRTSLLPSQLPIRTFHCTPASQLAKLQIIGRLADKPELTATSTGTEIVKYAVGSSNGKGENAKTSWFRITAFLQEGGLRDFVMGLGKGSLVYVEADASMNTYQDSEGKTRSSMNIVQRQIDVLTAKRDNVQEGGFPNES